ncbi:putative inorganic phosphate cotransporter [Choristoneura fumiferana]|uniref:putative inorganic phosphate cotransporter n=1 Tax=Choristoneura fumiferana TaxID=7141 RepID=UPI003D1559C4
MTIGYIARAHLGVSIVAMTYMERVKNMNSMVNSNVTINDTFKNVIETIRLNIINATDAVELRVNETSFEDEEPVKSIWNVFRTYDWSKPVQEMILGAFFVGYCLMMFPTGIACQRYGGKLPLQMCLLINGIISIATPTVAVWGGWKAVYGCRVLQGSTQAGLYPSAHSLLAKWVPISERATLSGYVYTGTLLGTVLAFQIAGLMASCAAGWPSTFWVTGGLCICAFTLLTIFGAASPADHKTISDAEKNFILGRIDDGKKKVIRFTKT